ncbi:MAG: hypothetical protein ACK5L6_08040 [Anaerorhabdus sp.]|uniref:hypothetical protein n=1 Tax=Anaerorhabdus sp. TaxID=1872524 RepID=UPI003A8A9421
MNLNKDGFILLDCCVCIAITLLITLCIFSVKMLEFKNNDSYLNFVEINEDQMNHIYSTRKRCEIECIEEVEPPLNS